MVVTYDANRLLTLVAMLAFVGALLWLALRKPATSTSVIAGADLPQLPAPEPVILPGWAAVGRTVVANTGTVRFDGRILHYLPGGYVTLQVVRVRDSWRPDAPMNNVALTLPISAIEAPSYV